MKFTKKEYNEAYNKVFNAAYHIYEKPQYSKADRETIWYVFREVTGNLKLKKNEKMAMMLYVIDSIIDKKEG